MRQVVVRYKVRADRLEENQRLVAAVFAELAETRPEGLRYEAFLMEDGASFLHLASIDTADGSNPLAATEAFPAFTARLQDRCEEPPEATVLTAIGRYGG